MSPALQTKLLRVLQEREFERVGDEPDHQGGRARASPPPTPSSRRMVADGTFREDLYYRLNVIALTLPPLRDRKEDMPLLVQHFIRKFVARDGTAPARRPTCMVSQDAHAPPDGLCVAGQRAPARERRRAGADPARHATQIEVADLPPEIQAVPVESRADARPARRSAWTCPDSSAASSAI